MNIKQPKEKHIPLLQALWKEAFGDADAFLDTFFATAFATNRCRCLFINDAPVAMLYWFHCEYEGQPVAYLYAIATAASHRGQGLCKQLMQDTHKHLERLGYQGALLVPGENSLFSFYEQLGYKSTCYIKEFTCTGTPQDLRPRRISANEYASLRRKHLPADSVIQEGENLTFLENECSFYAGEDFLLAARISPQYLYGLELLGNSEVAPGLVHFFGCAEGRFRTPGKDKPFAMYLPLYGSEQIPPSYFGFAFD